MLQVKSRRQRIQRGPEQGSVSKVSILKNFGSLNFFNSTVDFSPAEMFTNLFFDLEPVNY